MPLAINPFECVPVPAPEPEPPEPARPAVFDYAAQDQREALALDSVLGALSGLTFKQAMRVLCWASDKVRDDERDDDPALGLLVARERANDSD